MNDIGELELVKIRTLTEDEISVVYELSRKENWTCSIAYFRAHYDMDPDLFIGAEDCTTGTIIGG